MAGAPLYGLLQQMRKVLRPRGGGEADDANLLARFVERRDEAAFESLVWRHGPMVLAVCGRVLGDAHDVEDAFQATFLVLARRAGTIRKATSLSSWLHGTAYRTALKARAQAARRRKGEGGAMPPDPPDTREAGQEPGWDDLRPVLDGELDRLPRKYRTPLVLCYLEGKTQQEAAQQLGWQLGTLATRVLRGRELLRSRLIRRGLVYSVSGLTAILARSTASAAAPTALAGATVHHAALIVTGAAAAIPPHLENLVTGVLRTMTYTQMQKMMLAAVAVVLFGGGLVWYQGRTLVPLSSALATPEPATVLEPREAPAEAPDPGAKALKALQGAWKVRSLEYGSDKVPEKAVADYQLTFAGNKLTWDAATGIVVKGKEVTAVEGMYACSVKLDPSTEPKQIDITFHYRKGDRTLLGIYEIKGDTLKMAFSSSGQRRPRELSTMDNGLRGYMVLQREKK